MGLADFLIGTANVMDLPGSIARDLLAGKGVKQSFDQLWTPTSSENRTTGADLLRAYGMLGSRGDTGFGGTVAGMAAEMATDPTTWVNPASVLKYGLGAGLLGMAAAKGGKRIKTAFTSPSFESAMQRFIKRKVGADFTGAAKEAAEREFLEKARGASSQVAEYAPLLQQVSRAAPAFAGGALSDIPTRLSRGVSPRSMAARELGDEAASEGMLRYLGKTLDPTPVPYSKEDAHKLASIALKYSESPVSKRWAAAQAAGAGEDQLPEFLDAMAEEMSQPGSPHKVWMDAIIAGRRAARQTGSQARDVLHGVPKTYDVSRGAAGKLPITRAGAGELSNVSFDPTTGDLSLAMERMRSAPDEGELAARSYESAVSSAGDVSEEERLLDELTNASMGRVSENERRGMQAIARPWQIPVPELGQLARQTGIPLPENYAIGDSPADKVIRGYLQDLRRVSSTGQPLVTPSELGRVFRQGGLRRALLAENLPAEEIAKYEVLSGVLSDIAPSRKEIEEAVQKALRNPPKAEPLAPRNKLLESDKEYRARKAAHAKSAVMSLDDVKRVARESVEKKYDLLRGMAFAAMEPRGGHTGKLMGDRELADKLTQAISEARQIVPGVAGGTKLPIPATAFNRNYRQLNQSIADKLNVPVDLVKAVRGESPTTQITNTELAKLLGVDPTVVGDMKTRIADILSGRRDLMRRFPSVGGVYEDLPEGGKVGLSQDLVERLGQWLGRIDPQVQQNIVPELLPKASPNQMRKMSAAFGSEAPGGMMIEPGPAGGRRLREVGAEDILNRIMDLQGQPPGGGQTASLTELLGGLLSPAEKAGVENVAAPPLASVLLENPKLLRAYETTPRSKYLPLWQESLPSYRAADVNSLLTAFSELPESKRTPELEAALQAFIDKALGIEESGL